MENNCVFLFQHYLGFVGKLYLVVGCISSIITTCLFNLVTVYNPYTATYILENNLGIIGLMIRDLAGIATIVYMIGSFFIWFLKFEIVTYRDQDPQSKVLALDCNFCMIYIQSIKNDGGHKYRFSTAPFTEPVKRRLTMNELCEIINYLTGTEFIKDLCEKLGYEAEEILVKEIQQYLLKLDLNHENILLKNGELDSDRIINRIMNRYTFQLLLNKGPKIITPIQEIPLPERFITELDQLVQIQPIH